MILQNIYDCINTHADVINVVVAISAVIATVCIYRFSVKQSKESEARVEKMIRDHKEETLKFHDEINKSQLDFHTKLNNSSRSFHAQMIFEQNRPYLTLNPYTIDINLAKNTEWDDKNNGIRIGVDYKSEQTIDSIYDVRGVIADPSYNLELINHGMHKALHVVINYNVRFDNNDVLSKVYDKIKLIKADTESAQDIDFIGYESDNSFRIESKNYSGYVSLHGQIDTIDTISRNESVRFNVPKDLFLLHQALLSVDLATNQSSANLTYLLNDVFFGFDIQYSDAMGNRYTENFEYSHRNDFRGYGIEAGSFGTESVRQTLYPIRSEYEPIKVSKNKRK